MLKILWLCIFYQFVYLFGSSPLQQRMTEGGTSVSLMLAIATTLFCQTLRSPTEGNSMYFTATPHIGDMELQQNSFFLLVQDH